MNTTIDGIDYGPLAQLLGKWIGDKGMDKAPAANSDAENSAFTDELDFTAVGAVKNANEQELVSIKYHHIVRRKDDGNVFHDQIGHWIYEPATELIIHSLTIPRGVCVLAGGQFDQQGSQSIFAVEANAGNETFGIVQSPFMLQKAKTKTFCMELTVEGDELSYEETMTLHIYGKDFEHVDKSTLRRVTYG